ncbi:MAG: hypothetical protein PVJ86_06520 [Phycisphaerales bacterium]|jgi:hypothetical protein
MAINIKVFRRFLIIIVFGLFVPISRSGALNDEAQTKYAKNVTVAARALKSIYQQDEPVLLVVAIANHSTDPVYLSTETPDIIDPFVRVKDVNGVEVMGDPVAEPPPPPGHYYMVKDGKSVYTVPLSKIDGMGVLITLIPDALKIYHNHLSVGEYYLTPADIEIIHEVGSPIVREDVPHRLWVEPQSPMVRLRHKLNTVKIEVQRTAEVEKLAGQAYPFAWSTFLTGTICGMAALCLILLLKKKASSQSK